MTASAPGDHAMTVVRRDADLTRRALLAGGGALIVGFSLPAWAQQNKGEAPAPLPGSLKNTPMIDSWIRIGADGKITVLTGKAELGQGIKTALLQIAAEQLGVEPGAITLVTADTSQTANEGYTAGSHSMQDSGTAILHASAQARDILVGLAGASVQNLYDMSFLLQDHKPGETVEVVLLPRG